MIKKMMMPDWSGQKSSAKEIEVLSGFSEKEKHPVVERPKVPEIPPEIEKVEAVAGAEINLPQPITDDSGQIIVDTPTPQKVTITLPLSEEKILLGLRMKVVDSLRWLAEWCKRLLKIAKGKFIYKLT